MLFSYNFYKITAFLFIFPALCATIQMDFKIKEVKKMKKIFAVLLLVCTLFLFGCGKSETGTDTTASPPTTAATTGIPTATVTFPEGFTVVQIAERLEENGVCSAQDFIRLSNDADFIASLGYTFTEFIPGSQRAFLMEGYLFPDTYEFYLNDSAENVLKKILRNTSSKLTGEYSVRAKELGTGTEQKITISSSTKKRFINTYISIFNAFVSALTSCNCSLLKCVTARTLKKGIPTTIAAVFTSFSFVISSIQYGLAIIRTIINLT